MNFVGELPGLEFDSFRVYRGIQVRAMAKENRGNLSREHTSQILVFLKRAAELKLKREISIQEFEKMLEIDFDSDGAYLRHYLKTDENGQAIEALRGMGFNNMRICVLKAFYEAWIIPGEDNESYVKGLWILADLMNKIFCDEVSFRVIQMYKRKKRDVHNLCAGDLMKDAIFTWDELKLEHVQLAKKTHAHANDEWIRSILDESDSD